MNNMSIISLIILIVLVALAIAALKFLAGAARTIISIGLFVLAALLLLFVLTGNDPFGVGQATAGIISQVVG